MLAGGRMKLRMTAQGAVQSPPLTHGTGTRVCGRERGEDTGPGKKSSNGAALKSLPASWGLPSPHPLSCLLVRSDELILEWSRCQRQVLDIPPGPGRP